MNTGTMTDAQMHERDLLLSSWICPCCNIPLPSSASCLDCGESYLDEIQGPRFFALSRYGPSGHFEVIGVGDTVTPPVIPQRRPS